MGEPERRKGYQAGVKSPLGAHSVLLPAAKARHSSPPALRVVTDTAEWSGARSVLQPARRTEISVGGHASLIIQARSLTSPGAQKLTPGPNQQTGLPGNALIVRDENERAAARSHTVGCGGDQPRWRDAACPAPRKLLLALWGSARCLFSMVRPRGCSRERVL